MRALQLTDVNRLELVDKPVPTAPAGHLLVRTGAAVICTSDINDLRHNPFGIRLPVILGHEGAGTVAQVGEGVTGFGEGDRVAAHPVHPCMACAHCRAGLQHLCSDMGHFGLNMQGVFAEYFLVRADRARPAGNLPMEIAALAEPVCVCLEALAQANLRSGGTLLILGDGPFGALIANLAGGLNLERVVVAGHHDWRLAFAGGATVVNAAGLADPLAVLRQHGGELGYDAAILAVGSGQAAGWGLELLRPKGRLVVFSALPEPTPVDLFSLHVRELEIVGACNDDDRLDEAMASLEVRQEELGRLVTHRLPLERYEEAFGLAEHGRDAAMKVAFIFH